MQLEEKLYTSTEVAEILGVSLRSVYRYLDEGKLNAEIKTATGRHRFSKQNILDFLYPQGEKQQKPLQEPLKKDVKEKVLQKEADVPVTVEEEPGVDSQEEIEPKPTPQEVVTKEEKVQEESQKVEMEEPVDWLEKFRAAANKYREEVKPEVESETLVEQEQTISVMTEEEKAPEQSDFYYRSLTGGLKDIAQNIDKSARKASIDYAFTMNAGLSLHKPIKPFSLLHVYVRPEDREFFERMLHLVPAEKNNAQLCLITGKVKSVLSDREEMHGLYVASRTQLKRDLLENGEEELARELE